MQVDLFDVLPEFVEIEIKGKGENSSRVLKIRVEYDILPKYCKRCKMQGHNKDDCSIIYPKLRKQVHKREEGTVGETTNNIPRDKVVKWNT